MLREAEPPFMMLQRHRVDGVVHLHLIGEFDLAAAPGLGARLGQLARAGRRTRVDLSRVTFIDCAGLDAIVSALLNARYHGADLDVDDHPSACVRRLCRLTGMSTLLWPDGDDASDERRSSRWSLVAVTRRRRGRRGRLVAPSRFLPEDG